MPQPLWRGRAGRQCDCSASEADPAALLLHFFAGYGNLIGWSADCQVESTRHYANIFGGCVGTPEKEGKEQPEIAFATSSGESIDGRSSVSRVVFPVVKV